jgi:hypothetical protein
MLSLQIRSDFGELGERRFEIFDDLLGDDVIFSFWSTISVFQSYNR